VPSPYFAAPSLKVPSLTVLGTEGVLGVNDEADVDANVGVDVDEDADVDVDDIVPFLGGSDGLGVGLNEAGCDLGVGFNGKGVGFAFILLLLLDGNEIHFCSNIHGI